MQSAQIVHLSKNPHGPVVLISKDIAFTFPFGYAYLAGYLKEQGENVIIEFRPDSYSQYRDFAKKLISLKPLMVGIGTIYPDLYHAKELIAILNEESRDFPIVVGGQMVSPTPEFALEVTGADYGVIGEGEIILHELVISLRKNELPIDISGLAIREQNKIIQTGPGKFIRDMSKLPKIPFDLIPHSKWLNIGRYYVDLGQPHWRYNDRVIPIHGGRGCPYKCNFCYHHSMPRYRPISQMLEEADKLLNEYNANMLYFGDDLVIATKKRAQELVDGIKKLSKKVEYSISCRFNILSKIDDDLLRELKETGCRIMGLGIESGSQRILDIMHKDITVEQIISGLDRLKMVGILPTVSIMVGQYTETIEDAEKSFELMLHAVRTNKNLAFVSTITTPYPGTELYDIAVKVGKITRHYYFFNNYNPNIDFTGLTVNLSNMSDETVIKMRDKLEKTFYEEKNKLIGPRVIKVENKRKFAKKVYKKLQKMIFDRFPENRFLIFNNNILTGIYDVLQQGLDRKRLQLLGLTVKK